MVLKTAGSSGQTTRRPTAEGFQQPGFVQGPEGSRRLIAGSVSRSSARGQWDNRSELDARFRPRLITFLGARLARDYKVFSGQWVERRKGVVLAIVLRRRFDW